MINVADGARTAVAVTGWRGSFASNRPCRCEQKALLQTKQRKARARIRLVPQIIATTSAKVRRRSERGRSWTDHKALSSSCPSPSAQRAEPSLPRSRLTADHNTA